MENEGQVTNCRIDCEHIGPARGPNCDAHCERFNLPLFGRGGRLQKVMECKREVDRSGART